MSSQAEEMQKEDTDLQEKATDKGEAESPALDLSKGFSKKAGEDSFLKAGRGHYIFSSL